MSAAEDEVEMSTEEEVEETEESEESEEETYIETLTWKTIAENEDRIADYVDDPDTPEETAKNTSIKKFVVQRVLNKLLDSLEQQLKWIEDTDLASMMKKWKKATSKDDELDASDAMKIIIKESAVIGDTVEQHLGEMLDDAQEVEEEA